MSLFDRLQHCSISDLSGFRPWLIGDAQVGWLRHDVADALRRYPTVFAVGEDTVRLQSHLVDFDHRSAAVGEVVRSLAEYGIVQGWRNEAFAVVADYGQPPLLRLERAAVPVFGVKAYGVHMNGYVRDGGRIRLWIGQRADTRQVEPGKLDNIVAGGVPFGLDPMSNLIKECGEEAGIEEALARRAIPVGAMSYRMLHQGFLRQDTLFLYDLELPVDFVPTNTDGEIASFRLMELDEVARILAESDAFKFNVAPVIIDFLVRHGYFKPDEPGYADLAMGLSAFQPVKS
jgi:8-oxo-dGTP pyrophosphatase MutT (NUDIX family)